MITEIELEDLQDIVDNGATLIDCREDEEVAEGMIPGAIHIALSVLHESADELPESSDIVFYCRSGKRSLKACEIVESWDGDRNLYSLAGGYLAYQDAQE